MRLPYCIYLPTTHVLEIELVMMAMVERVGGEVAEPVNSSDCQQAAVLFVLLCFQVEYPGAVGLLDSGFYTLEAL